MTQTQSTRSVRTLTAEILMPVTVVPCTIAPGVDEQTADHAVSIFYAMANREGRTEHTARATIDGTAGTVLYTHDGEVTARTLFPSRVWLTDDELVAASCYCTYRNETRIFRLDRMTCVQHVTMPGEIATAA